jgi:TrmH family RNA methyltransferase
MISKNKVKYIKSLQVKKYRKQEQRFIVEGAKGVSELLSSQFDIECLLGTRDFIAGHASALNALKAEVLEVTPKDLEGLGAFQTNDAVLAIAMMKPNEPAQIGTGEFVLALDDIRDPGNLGTIIRTADWFGVKWIVASEETADFYNPKVINATMGSFARVGVYYCSLPLYLQNADVKIYGAFLDGTDVHQQQFPNSGIVVIGNESQGISSEVQKLVTDRITIPGYGKAESLNAAAATAVILDNVRARQSKK